MNILLQIFVISPASKMFAGRTILTKCLNRLVFLIVHSINHASEFSFYIRNQFFTRYTDLFGFFARVIRLKSYHTFPVQEDLQALLLNESFR